MEIDAFWDLIEQSRRETGDHRSRADRLQAELAKRRPAEIADFQVLLDRTRRRVDTYDVWAAASLILDGFCSGDSFWYFQAWLVGLGRDAFARVAADPDDLADLPEVTRLAGRPMRDWSEADEWPEWELLNYAAVEAYDQATGESEGIYEVVEARGHDVPEDPDPTGDAWDYDDPAELRRRLPRLSGLFPRT